MSTAHGIETEVKIRISDTGAAQRRLIDAGFVISVPRGFEDNTVYDTADLTLKNGEMLLRLRQFGAKATITWKGPGVPSAHKSRAESETTVGSLETLDKILRALGYQPTFRYEKYRTEYSQPQSAGEGVVTFDETPIGDFLELEGAPEWIDRTAALLGYAPDAYVLLSYGRLYLDHCAALGVDAGDMVFAALPQNQF